MSEIQIPIDDVKDNFNSFLKTDDNSRIFFSGRFGIGKTFFLNNFFNAYNEEYETFHLYPVNYQLSCNEDVLELIKYDILVELLKKNKDIFQDNTMEGIKDSSILFYSWCRKNFSLNSILQSVLSIGASGLDTMGDPVSICLGKLGRPLRDLLEIDKKFQEFKEEYKKGEKDLVEKFRKEITAKSISEDDYFSHLLKEKIIRQKGTKKSVLVLDDLDRIDPEHIFRILNILAAYFEKENENKFGFDSIIVVADYENIKNIFCHRYGARTDFSGYLDKFFTISPYYFDNKKAVIDMVSEITKSIRNEEPSLNGALDDSGYIKIFLENIFLKAVDNEIINMRELLKATKFQLLELKKGSYREDMFSDNFQKIFDKAVKVAIHSFSNADIFIEKINIIKNVKVKSKEILIPGRFIIAMLKSLGVKIPENEGNSISWNKYKINVGAYNSISVDNDLEEDLFFDLLIEYVKNKKYIKNGDYDYRK